MSLKYHLDTFLSNFPKERHLDNDPVRAISFAEPFGGKRVQAVEPLFKMDGSRGGRDRLRCMDARLAASACHSTGHAYCTHIELHRHDRNAQPRLGDGAGHNTQPAAVGSGRSRSLRFCALSSRNRR